MVYYAVEQLLPEFRGNLATLIPEALLVELQMEHYTFLLIDESAYWVRNRISDNRAQVQFPGVRIYFYSDLHPHYSHR